MSIEGRIAIDVSFADSAEGTSVQSLKKIAMVDTDTYTTGKAAIFTGTVGTAGAIVQTVPTSPAYRDATGAVVSFSNVSRIAFQASQDCTATDGDDPSSRVRSRGSVALTDWAYVGTTIEITPLFTAGTASYTLVLYGT